MPLVDAYAERKYLEVREETWGHLRPKAGRAYTGFIVFALGCHGDIVPIQYEFNKLPSSPWFFHQLLDYMGENTDGHDPGTIFKFVGTYTRFKNGNGKFRGKLSHMTVNENTMIQ